MVGNILLGEITHITAMRFRIVRDFESYINNIDKEYDSEDAILQGISIS